MDKMAKLENVAISWPFPGQASVFGAARSPTSRSRTASAPHTVSLVQRSVVGLLLLIVVAAVMLAADLVVAASGAAVTTTPLALGVMRLVSLGLALLVISASTERPVIIGTILASMVLHTASGVLLGSWRGQPETSAIVAVAISVGSAVLLPWGPLLQAMLVSALLAVLAAGETLLAGSTYPLTLLLPSIGAMASSVFLARELETTRARLIEKAAEDAEARLQAARLHAQLEAAIAERTASLNATKEEFVGLCQAASHDLRPPLRSMAGFSEILRETAVKQAQPTQVQHLDRIIEFADAMGTRIDDLLHDVRNAHREVARSLDTPSETEAPSVLVPVHTLPAPPEATVVSDLARRLRGTPPKAAAGTR